MNPHGLNSGRYVTGNMQKGKQVGIGEQFAENLETSLAPPHTGQPIVNQRHFHGEFKTCGLQA